MTGLMQRPRFANTAMYQTNPLQMLLSNIFGNTYGRAPFSSPSSDIRGRSISRGNILPQTGQTGQIEQGTPERTGPGFGTDLFRLPQLLQFVQALIAQNPNILNQISSGFPPGRANDFVNSLPNLMAKLRPPQLPERIQPASRPDVPGPTQGATPPIQIPPSQNKVPPTSAPGSRALPPADIALTQPPTSWGAPITGAIDRVAPTPTPAPIITPPTGIQRPTPAPAPTPIFRIPETRFTPGPWQPTSPLEQAISDIGIKPSPTFNEGVTTSPLETAIMRDIVERAFTPPIIQPQTGIQRITAPAPLPASAPAPVPIRDSRSWLA